MFQKILIANRGEIAVRVIRACRLLGIQTVAVYSDVDARAPHVQAADHAVHLGPSEPLQSYLNMERILAAAKSTGAEAIHPGYGFLAENAAFAKRCSEERLVFIGPPWKAIALMGDKLASRKLMSEKGIPIIPGMTAAGGKPQELARFAEEIGYPVILKAAAGGGGKGMRIIRKRPELAEAAESAGREARKAFGDGTIYLEKYLERPRHIEFQILLDPHGHCVHLFERECSVQRRHQKIVEETPSTALDPKLREKMGETAKKIALLAGYQNAGTVEFLLDPNRKFYFLEMNTRIQVEHPVTELTTGVDLVVEQLRIAAGEKLGFSQEDLFQRGHAIECRIYAEDPENKFLPSPGKILALREPVGPGIRVDSGIEEGFEIPIHYDPILSKLIVSAENRALAIDKMRLALVDYKILGPKTTIPFLYDLIGHEGFRAGNLSTGFIEEHFSEWRLPTGRYQTEALLAAAILEVEKTAVSAPIHRTAESGRPTPWQLAGRFRLGESGR